MAAGREGCLFSKTQEHSKLSESPSPPSGENLAGLRSTSWKVQKKQGRKEERGKKGKQEKVGRRKRNVLRHRDVWGFGTILVYVLEKDVYPKVGYSSL